MTLLGGRGDDEILKMVNDNLNVFFLQNVPDFIVNTLPIVTI